MEDMTEVFKAEAEALRKELAEKDDTIKYLDALLDNALAEVESLRDKLAEKDKEIKHLNDLLDNALKELDKYIQGK